MNKLLLLFFTFLCFTIYSNAITKFPSKIGILTIDNPTVAENSGQGVFTLNLSEASLTDTVINFTIAGTATSSNDYVPLQSTTVTIAAGETSKTITILITDDLIVEGTETVILDGNIISSNTQNTNISGILTITDNDTAVVTVTAMISSCSEPSANGLYTFSMSNPSSTNTLLTYAVTGTATSNIDYKIIDTTVLIPANATNATLPLLVIDDFCVEPIETITITLLSTLNTAITVNNAPATIAIYDNDSSLITVTATTNASSTTNGAFTISTSAGCVDTDIDLLFTVTGTANNGIDYLLIPVTTVIPAGANSVTIPINTTTNKICSGNKTVILTLVAANNPNLTINTTPATLTITRNTSTLAATVNFTSNTATALANGGVTPYNYSLNNGAFQGSNVFSNIVYANNNNLKVRDAAGCEVFNTTTNPCDLRIIINRNLDVPTSLFYVELSTFSQTPLVGMYNYTLDGGAAIPLDANFSATIVASTLGTGNHTIVVTDANGCSVAENFFGGIANIQLEITGSYNDYNNDGFVNLGDIINLQYKISNTTNYNFSNVNIINNSIAGLTINGNTIPVLAANTIDNTSFSGVQVLTQQDINSGFVGTNATATASLNATQVSVVNDYGLQLNISSGFKLNAFIDANGNGVQDGGEVNFTGGSFIYQLAGNSAVNVYSNGTFYLYENNPSNNYNFSFTLPNSTNICGYNYTLTTSSYSNISISGNNITTYNFAINQNICTDLQISLSNFGGPRPGFTNYNYIYYKNNGNVTIPSGTIIFTKDALFGALTTNPASSTTSTGFSYDFTNLVPNETRFIDIQMQVPTIPTVSIGDLTTNVAIITIPAGDINTTNNSSSLTQDIRGSFDPNDKQESHGPQIIKSTFTANDYLTYKIEFENAGNVNAITVKVKDVLDAKLDPSTIKMIGASHNYTLKRVDNSLEWTFAGIDLLPSVPDTQIGHGYLIFQVKPVANYVVGTNIPNTANIYFDFNPPIVTNTWNTEFVTNLSNSSFVFNDLKIYPNPTNNILNISNSEKIDKLEITNILGQNIFNNSVNNSQTTIDLSNLISGIYFVKLWRNDLNQIIKVIKK